MTAVQEAEKQGTVTRYVLRNLQGTILILN
jgi:hypothetical protein